MEDYLIVEDTNKLMWEFQGDQWNDEEENAHGRQKMSDLRYWLLNHEDEYLIEELCHNSFFPGSRNWRDFIHKI